MTAPRLPLAPPRDFENITTRECFSAVRTGENGGPTPGGTGPRAVPDVDLTIADGSDVTVMLAQPAAETDYWPRSVWFDTRAFNQMRVVIDDVEEAGHTTARVVAKYKATVGGAFATPGAAGAEVPAPIATTGPQKSTAWVALDPAAIGERLWHPFAVGGNGVLTPVVGGVHLQFRQATLPRPARRPTVPGSLLARWRSSVAGIAPDLTGNGNDAALGAGAQAPAVSVSPEGHGPFGSGGFLLLKYIGNDTLPWDASGGNNLRAMSLAFYLTLTDVVPGDGYWVFQFSGGAGGDLNVRLFAAGQIRASRWQGAADAIAQSGTALANGDQCVVHVTCGASAGEFLRVYVNGVLDAEETLATDIPAFSSQPVLFWGANFSGFTSEAGVPGIIGQTEVYDGELSAAQVAASYADFKTLYPGLP